MFLYFSNSEFFYRRAVRLLWHNICDGKLYAEAMKNKGKIMKAKLEQKFYQWTQQSDSYTKDRCSQYQDFRTIAF